MFLFSLHLGEGSFHNLGRPGIGIGKPAAVYPKSDGSGSMPKPATDGQDVHSGGDELGDLGMLDGVQAPWSQAPRTKWGPGCVDRQRPRLDSERSRLAWSIASEFVW